MASGIHHDRSYLRRAKENWARYARFSANAREIRDRIRKEKKINATMEAFIKWRALSSKA